MRSPSVPALVVALALGCGARPAPPAPPRDLAPAPAGAPRPGPSPTPFPRVTALPASPRMVIRIDMAVLRDLPAYAPLRGSMEGDAPRGVVGRRLIDHTERVELGGYGRASVFVLIARGPGLGARVEPVVEELRASGHDLARVERLGFVGWYVAERMVVVATAPDTVVMTDPSYLDDLLRVAAGQEPASPLPPAVRAFEGRRGFEGADLSMIFAPENDASAAPLRPLYAEAEYVGYAGRVVGGAIRTRCALEASSPERATVLAADLETAARAVTPNEVSSAALAQAIRGMTVETDGPWIEAALDVPRAELEGFLEIVNP